MGLARRLKELFNVDWREPSRYDLVVSTERMSIETAARMIVEFSQHDEYRQSAESLQSMKDLTIGAIVETALMVPRLDISNLEVEVRGGAVRHRHSLDGIKEIAVDTIRQIPGVTRVDTAFVVRPSDPYLYGDGR